MNKRKLQTGQTIKNCKICGADITGMEGDICYQCEVETSQEIKPILKKG